MIRERLFLLKSMTEMHYLQITLSMIKSVFTNTDSHVSRLTANFVFQAFERQKMHN